MPPSRTLYVEADTMAGPDYDKASRVALGSIASVDGRTLTLGAELDADTYGNNSFQGGTITLLDEDDEVLGTFGIESNTATTVTLSADLPAGIAERVVKLRDLNDDDVGQLSDLSLELDWLNWYYGPACIVVNIDRHDLHPTDAGVNVNDIVPFIPNIEQFQGDLPNLLFYPDESQVIKQAMSSKDFWVVHLIGAFQGELDLDLDSNTEHAQYGVTALAGNVSYIFKETIRDKWASDPLVRVARGSYQEIAKLVAIHEVFHQFGYKHPLVGDDSLDWGGVMNTHALLYEDWSVLPFTGKALRQMMSTAYPQRGSF